MARRCRTAPSSRCCGRDHVHLGHHVAPEAVVHTHANVIWASRVGPDNIALDTDDRYMIYTPFFHVNAQSWATWSALGVGATIVLTPKWSATRFWDVVTKHDVTHFSVMGFTMQAIVGKPIPPNKLKVGVFGLTMPPLEKMIGFRLTSNWGMTETVTHATRNQLAQDYPAGTMGRPTPGTSSSWWTTRRTRSARPARSASSGCAVGAVSSSFSSTSTRGGEPEGVHRGRLVQDR